tara:strand:+ start:103 stop:750 length:648 start_codon:yes stop_codon:yes gene_type:complete
MTESSVCFLLDESNVWIRPYTESFVRKLGLDIKKNIVFDPLKASSFKICFLLGYTKILKLDDLGHVTSYFVIHESDLPKGKGFSPIIWQILEGKKEIDICLLEVSEKVDSGDIVLKNKIKFQGTELYEEIRSLQAVATFDLIEQFLNDYPSTNPIKQQGKSSFYKRRSPSDNELDVNASIKDQFNLLRVSNNEDWPAFFELNGKRFILKIFNSDQ